MKKDVEMKIFEEGLISTGREISITFMPNGKTAYFCRGGKPPFSIMESHYENGNWNAPNTASFSGKYHDSDPFVTPDGKKLYFFSRRPGREGEYAHIWVVERDGNAWGEAKELEHPINTIYNEVYPSVTVDGILYFTSSRPGGQGFSDIYCSRFAEGKYTEPYRLNGNISTKAMEFDACIAYDESFLLFSRQTNESGFEIFLTFNKDGSWTKPKSIRELTGLENRGRFAPTISPDSKQLYFSSGGNICYIDDFDVLINEWRLY